WEVNLFYLNRSKSTKVKLTLNPNEMWRPSGFKLSLWVPWLRYNKILSYETLSWINIFFLAVQMNCDWFGIKT
ncbi:MAG: hypothetical protein ACTS4Y_00805, partial [Candidatus Hodgkinia cicadicola]